MPTFTGVMRAVSNALLAGVGFAALAASPALAQHEERATSARPPPGDAMPGMDMAQTGRSMGSMKGVLGLPMARDGSGTSWQPDASATRALDLMAGDWAFMLHWNVFGGYDWQGGSRGDERLTSINWLMGMARHDLAGGQLTARAMVSLEPLTVGASGYPLLLQTGETAGGVPLHDHQHPHDLFMELALRYQRPLSGRLAFELYVAPAGEPALGPVAFPHRASASSDPLAVIGHHWQDSTHISYGVLSAGLFTPEVKLEASWFNGREPDENRWDLDLRPLDSWSVRASVNPSAATSFQASYGELASPERLEASVSLRRVTASALYAASMGRRGHWASAAIFGLNVASEGPATHATTIESDLDLDGRNVLFGRAELGVKSGRDLVLLPAQQGETFSMAALALGFLRRFDAVGPVVPALGVRASVNVSGSALGAYYGSRTPVGLVVFVELTPPAVEH